MAAKKRASSRSRQSSLVGRAVTAGRKALREAESRVPRDVRRQFERSIKDGQKTLTRAIDQLQAQVRRTAKQADVEKALKRLDGLSKQVQQLARGATSPGAAKPRRSTRKASGTAKRAHRPRGRSTYRSRAPRQGAPKGGTAAPTGAGPPTRGGARAGRGRELKPPERSPRRALRLGRVHPGRHPAFHYKSPPGVVAHRRGSRGGAISRPHP